MLDFNKLEEIIDKFREELTLANRSGDEELNALKESDPNKYKRILTERQNNINAQFDKKARGREYRQNAWDKKTKQGVLHKEEKAKTKYDSEIDF